MIKLKTIEDSKVIEIANSWGLFADSKYHLNIFCNDTDMIFLENSKGIIKIEGSGFVGIDNLLQELMLFEDPNDQIVQNTIQLVNDVRRAIIDYCNEFHKKLKQEAKK